ncbi:MAG TPA: acetyl-CoA acetyltransferase, partial [Candidatus Binatia bacterium]|nr:acetyl-CoA acetyltransferase [Candidatus Binatia bacterium]
MPETIEPNTPLIAGIGFAQERAENPAECEEPWRLMAHAVRGAAADAGSEALLGHIESIAVPQGMWEYRNPGRLIAEAVGCPSARSILADLGVLQLSLVSDVCRAIAAGEQHVGVITGGEAKFRELRAAITGAPVSNTTQPEDTPAPDVHHTSSDPWATHLESRAGLAGPVELFAIMESALRHADGLDVERHRDRLAELYSRFSAVAADNPHAWRREPLAPAAIRDPALGNAMLAFPYTKRHSSQWNVNQAVAILVCSAARASDLRLDRRGWVFPVAAAQSKHVVPLAQQRKLHSHAGTVRSGERALELAGLSVRDLDVAELYSCFPAAIQSFARDLGIPDGCPWTVTGAMPFAGGPYNSFSLEGVARMVEVLRDGSLGPGRRIGLVSNLSGIFGKQACALFSNQPAHDGYRYADVTAEVAASDPPVALDGDYAGPAAVVGYTVVFSGGAPSHAIAICDTPDGRRTVVRSEERDLLAAMMREEFC